MHVDSLCLPFFTSHANLQFGSFSTLSDVFKFEAFCKVVLLRLETLSPVPGHTVDSLGGMLIFAQNPTFVEKKNKVPARSVRE